MFQLQAWATGEITDILHINKTLLLQGHRGLLSGAPRSRRVCSPRLVVCFRSRFERKWARAASGRPRVLELSWYLYIFVFLFSFLFLGNGQEAPGCSDVCYVSIDVTAGTEVGESLLAGQQGCKTDPCISFLFSPFFFLFFFSGGDESDEVKQAELWSMGISVVLNICKELKPTSMLNSRRKQEFLHVDLFEFSPPRKCLHFDITSQGNHLHTNTTGAHSNPKEL